MSQPTTPIGPVDATRIPRYAGPATFARLPRIDEVSRADVAVLGVPFDSGVSYRPGARFGPGHIRASSKLLRPYNPAQDVSPFGVLQVADAGDVAVNPFDLREAVQQIETAVTGVRADGATVLTLGGDHTIALPILRSLSRDHGPIAVLHFDAHLDTWDTYFGAPYTHGTPFDAFIDFPPYNEHLLHDVGAFQIGIGVSVLLALMWSDSIGVALVAFYRRWDNSLDQSRARPASGGPRFRSMGARRPRAGGPGRADRPSLGRVGARKVTERVSISSTRALFAGGCVSTRSPAIEHLGQRLEREHECAWSAVRRFQLVRRLA
jgi:hypothetical protein